MMQDELDFFLDQPWECEGLDPFWDDPVAADSEFDCNDGEEGKSDDENIEVSDNQEALCTCGNCAHMPSLEERLCCKRLVGWQREYKSTGAKVVENSYATQRWFSHFRFLHSISQLTAFSA